MLFDSIEEKSGKLHALGAILERKTFPLPLLFLFHLLFKLENKFQLL